jgi:hypothetical protein
MTEKQSGKQLVKQVVSEPERPRADSVLPQGSWAFRAGLWRHSPAVPQVDDLKNISAELLKGGDFILHSPVLSLQRWDCDLKSTQV